MRKEFSRPRAQLGGMLLLSSLVSIGLFLYGALRNHSWDFDYFIWNLFLAWLPLLFAMWLVSVLRRKLWSSWEAIVASVLWLLFLPNSFYMVSDFIHLDEVQRVNIVYDVVMFSSFIFIGVFLGLSSLYLVHREFHKRFSRRGSTAWLAGIILVCSFAIYLGRDLRWNSWDVLTNPAGLLFDISDRLIHPMGDPQMFSTVLSFFVLITSMYTLAWKTVQLIRQTTK
jgi:uncharacterized membrane protein